MTNPHTIEVTSLADYVEKIGREFPTWEPLFRGQPHDWPLLPSLARQQTRAGDDLLQAETRMVFDLKRRGHPLCETTPETDLEWIALGQHHGLPTRLLDWTPHSLAALWFAVRKAPSDDRPAVVRVLDASPEDEAPSGLDPFTITRTMTYRPRHLAKRITAQAGRFTVHAAPSGTFVPLDAEGTFDGRVAKISIAAEHLWHMRWDLDRCGVNDAHLFGDLDALCEHLRWSSFALDDEHGKKRGH